MADIGSAELMALAWSLGWRIAAGIIIGYYVDQWLGQRAVADARRFR
jgi:hypothetical protein